MGSPSLPVPLGFEMTYTVIAGPDCVQADRGWGRGQPTPSLTVTRGARQRIDRPAALGAPSPRNTVEARPGYFSRRGGAFPRPRHGRRGRCGRVRDVRALREGLLRSAFERGRAAVARVVTGLRSRRGLLLWVVGTLGILAAVAMSGDLGLLIFLADRELLVLVVESAAAYGVYAWRSGTVAVAWAMVRTSTWPWFVRFHVLSTRWSC